MNKFRNRVLFFYILISIAMCALVGRLVYIHVFWSDELTGYAKAQQNKNIPIPAERGVIMDRNGDKLAFSVRTYSVWAQVSEITKYKETADLIASVVEANTDDIVNKLINAKSSFVKVVVDLTKSEADLVRSKGIRGISITEDTKRQYPYNTLASHIVGNVNVDGDGFTGLELYYNNTLKGVSGIYHVTTDVYGRQLPYGEDDLEAPINGESMMLTIDDSIQFFVEQRLEAAMEQHQAETVSAIVMDPMTGEILAMSSKPDFDLNTPRAYGDDYTDAEWALLSNDERMQYWNETWKNKTISDAYEPGSTFKSIIAAIALEEGLVTMNSTFNCTGSKVVNGVTLKCVSYPEGHGHQDLTQAFVNSCNPSFIEIGSRIGVDKLFEYFEKFELLETTNVALPAEGKSFSVPKDKVGPLELATMSYGHGINLTMIQVVRTMSALVNGGYLYEPQIVKSLMDASGNEITSFAPKQIKQIISTETSDIIKILLEKAVQSGGGKRAYIEGVRVGGKSGTTVKFVDGTYEDEVVLLSFVGIAPIDDPQFIVMVVVDEPKDEFFGSLVAGPIVKNIIEDILRYKNIVPDVASVKEIEVPTLVGLTLKEAKEKLDALGIAYATSPVGITDDELVVLNQYPVSGTKIDSNSIIILSTEE